MIVGVVVTGALVDGSGVIGAGVAGVGVVDSRLTSSTWAAVGGGEDDGVLDATDVVSASVTGAAVEAVVTSGVCVVLVDSVLDTVVVVGASVDDDAVI